MKFKEVSAVLLQQSNKVLELVHGRVSVPGQRQPHATVGSQGALVAAGALLDVGRQCPVKVTLTASPRLKSKREKCRLSVTLEAVSLLSQAPKAHVPSQS